MVDMLDFLRSENINESIIKGVEEFRAKHAVHEEDKKRIVEPRYHSGAKKTSLLWNNNAPCSPFLITTYFGPIV